jgi:NTP pyrophosphatase (non-canonical NTP hydrolase)
MNFNQLSPAETERLAMLAEEAGEVVQTVGKILRHGYETHHPDTPDVMNRELLTNEVRDFIAVVALMAQSTDLPLGFEVTEENIQRRLNYTHHQEGLQCSSM